MKVQIEIEISEDNESTYAPYWQIIDPKILKDVIRGIRKHGNGIKYEELTKYIAFSTTGIFFSRLAADNHLKAHNYNYSDHAIVWCNSGHASFEYTQAIKKSLYAGKTNHSMKLEDVVTECRNDPEKQFLVKIKDVNWIGTLKYLLFNIPLYILINKEFELYTIPDGNKDETSTTESQAVC